MRHNQLLETTLTSSEVLLITDALRHYAVTKEEHSFLDVLDTLPLYSSHDINFTKQELKITISVLGLSQRFQCCKDSRVLKELLKECRRHLLRERN